MSSQASSSPPSAAGRVVYEGKHFTVVHETVNTPDGTPQTFEYVLRGDGARIVAIRDGAVLLNHEFRHELQADDWRLPGGKLDPGESPENGARREFREETGYSGGHWEYLWSSTPDSTVRYQRHFFLARDVEPGEPARDPGEQISTHWIPLNEACELALGGSIREEISALALLRLQARLAKSGK